MKGIEDMKDDDDDELQSSLSFGSLQSCMGYHKEVSYLSSPPETCDNFHMNHNP